MASGFAQGGGGSLLGLTGSATAWHFGSYSTDTLGGFIQEAQLADFFFSQGGPQPKLQPFQITTSAALPGSTHWDPAPVPVGKPANKPPTQQGVVFEAGIPIPVLDIFSGLPSFENEGQPPIIFSPAPIILPGQVDPGVEEQESEEGEMAHTWLHLGSQVIGALLPGQSQTVVTPQNFGGGPAGFVAGPGQVGMGPGTIPGQQNSGATLVTGNCPPAKTRTLTIDCATGMEVKRKRRRRRALLTQGDMGVLFQIASLPNSANVRVALAGAIRR